MPQAASIAPILPAFSPERAVEAWPTHVPLAALLSRGNSDSPTQRFSVLATIANRLSPEQWLQRNQLSGPSHEVEGIAAPFTILTLTYELGAAWELGDSARKPGQWGLGEVLICPAAYVFDHHQDRWLILGESDLLPTLGEPGGEQCSIGTMHSATGRERYEAMVARAVEYIRAGDIFQANLTHRLRASFSGSARTLFARLVRTSEPAYGAYIDAAAGTILSLSPELFLEFDPKTRRCVTRPMKGTACALDGRHTLESSDKDAAELRMIVDLMRNDLSRVCEIGSVRVDVARVIETHAGGDLFQGVATVSGTLRAEKSLNDLIVAAFPAGSITGAPKVRAMQIIDELEQGPRGPYCGSIGLIDANGRAVFSVGIRTAMITGERGDEPGCYAEGLLEYPVGAGIVADSCPSLEWAETMAKASVWDRVAETGGMSGA